MSFQQGLSGLSVSSKALDIISNNVANTNTIGFKTGSAIFSDVFAASLTGSISGKQVGVGATLGAVRQTFTQGNLTTTNNPLDPINPAFISCQPTQDPLYWNLVAQCLHSSGYTLLAEASEIQDINTLRAWGIDGYASKEAS